MEKIIKILDEICPGVDFQGGKDFIENGLLDSFDIISLVTELNDEFDIDIGVIDIIPENFSNLEAIKRLVDSLQ